MSWIEDFLGYTDNITSPYLFRKWTAIWAVASSMERKVWVRTKKDGVLYPTLYALLCGPPGIGKGEVLVRAREIMEEAGDIHLAPSSITKAAFVDELNKAERKIVRVGQDPPLYNFNSLQILSNEFGVFLPEYEKEFMSVLTDLYDGQKFSERRRSRNHEPIDIDNPQVNIIGGTTPAQLTDMLPEGAWLQGFMSRMFIVFSSEKIIQDLFDFDDESDADRRERKRLIAALKKIHNLFGKMEYHPEAAQLFNQWWRAGAPPEPDHPKLISYNSRRNIHVIKLSMIAAAADGASMNVMPEHFQTALDWLIEVEHHMPDVFKAMTSGGASKTIEDAWHYIFTTYSKEQKPVAEHRLLQFLQERVPIYEVDPTLASMEKSGLIKKQLIKGGAAYVPGTRHAK
jgi:hypothetical protein